MGDDDTRDPKVEYKKYLASPAWKAKAADARAHADNRCERCGLSKKLDVHHLTYERVPNEEPGDLQALCRDCHDLAHEDPRILAAQMREEHRRRVLAAVDPTVGSSFEELVDKTGLPEAYVRRALRKLPGRVLRPNDGHYRLSPPPPRKLTTDELAEVINKNRRLNDGT